MPQNNIVWLVVGILAIICLIVWLISNVSL